MDRQDKQMKLGHHVLVDAWGASREMLDDPAAVRRAVEQAVVAVGATLVNLTVHQFSPQGVTAVATLAESHLALHTWPEYGFVGLDLFLCGETAATPAVEVVCEALGATERRVQTLTRSMPARLDLVGGTRARHAVAIRRPPGARAGLG